MADGQLWTYKKKCFLWLGGAWGPSGGHLPRNPLIMIPERARSLVYLLSSPLWSTSPETGRKHVLSELGFRAYGVMPMKADETAQTSRRWSQWPGVDPLPWRRDWPIGNQLLPRRSFLMRMKKSNSVSDEDFHTIYTNAWSSDKHLLEIASVYARVFIGAFMELSIWLRDSPACCLKNKIGGARGASGHLKEKGLKGVSA